MVGKLWVPSTPPVLVIAAATWASAWVSTPPITVSLVVVVGVLMELVVVVSVLVLELVRAARSIS